MFQPPLRIVDAHCDTLWTAPREERTLLIRSSQGHLDLPRLLSAGVHVQFFALFSDPHHGRVGFTVEALAMIERFYEAVDGSSGVLRPLLWQEDLEHVGEGHVYGLLSIEGAEPLHGRIDLLRLFFRLGVRAIGLTWNYRNELADGQLDAESGGGLTPSGRAIVQEMERLGMLIDCSHLSDAGFWDLAQRTSGPFIASHSNSRAVCDHRRNLTDEQMQVVAGRGGVMGINFHPGFLRTGGDATLDDIIRHIDYMAERVGPQAIGLGSDFDGISRTPIGVEDTTKLPRVADALVRRGYGETDIRGIMGENFLRVLQAALPQKTAGS